MKAEQVIIFTNGNIMVFDKDGEQMQECQGCVLDVKIIRKLNKYCDKDTKFYFGDWGNKIKNPVNVRWWFEQKTVQ